MAFHSGMRGLIRAPDEKPKITRDLLKRVMQYALPYKAKIIGMLVLILVSTGLMLVTPLILRDLIDRAIPEKDLRRLVMLVLALLVIPLLNGALGVIKRRLNADIGEGVIFDLRVSLYATLQRMSLRFFTKTKQGELMSRLNNDVVGAQNAINSTLVNMISDIVQTVALLVVMLSLE